MQPICSLVVRKKTSAYNRNGKAQLTIFQWKYLVQQKVFRKEKSLMLCPSLIFKNKVAKSTKNK